MNRKSWHFENEDLSQGILAIIYAQLCSWGVKQTREKLNGCLHHPMFAFCQGQNVIQLQPQQRRV